MTAPSLSGLLSIADGLMRGVAIADLTAASRRVGARRRPRVLVEPSFTFVRSIR